MRISARSSFFFFFNDTATTEIYTLSLHDALPIWLYRQEAHACAAPVHHIADHLEDFLDRKSTRLNSSHVRISYAVFCLKKKKKKVISITDPHYHEVKSASDQVDNLELILLLVKLP